jgi:hypothetical protein
MAKTDNITAEQVRELLDYDPETGIFTWKVKLTRWHKIGSIAAHLSGEYLRVKIFDNYIRAHRLAWLYVYGEFPKHDIDHRNGNPRDNSIANLRDVPTFINLENQRKPRSNNKSGSGYLGVGFEKGKWRARIRVHGKEINLGRFNTPQEAHEAYIAAKRILHEGNTL